MSGFAWVEGLEAYCFTVVVGLTSEEAIRRLGADPHEPQCPRTFEECFWPADGPQWAQVGPAAGGLIVAEHNGWRAEECAAALSRGAIVTSFFRNVEAVMHFVYAVDGEVVAEFDPLLDTVVVAGTRPRAMDAAMKGLAFGLHAAEPSAMSLIERLTGVTVSDQWLHQPQRAVRLPSMSEPTRVSVLD
jgi:hypothetical protein